MEAGTTLSALIGAILLAAAPPPAEPQPGAATEEQIVVTGERVSGKAISAFVDQLVGRPRQLPLSTWRQEVCPSVHGLPAPQAAKARKRMRDIAATVGMRLGAEGCQGNVVLIVTPDKPLFLRTLAQRSSFYFDGMPFWRVNEIVRDPSLSTAWHLKGEPVRPGGASASLAPTTEAASRLRPSAVPTFDAAVVVVDAKAIDGLTVTQLADYASMRAYAPARPDRVTASTTTSILSVIDAPATAEVPASLTRWDLGLLRGLYAGTSPLPAGAERSELKKAVEREVGKR